MLLMVEKESGRMCDAVYQYKNTNSNTRENMIETKNCHI